MKPRAVIGPAFAKKETQPVKAIMTEPINNAATPPALPRKAEPRLDAGTPFSFGAAMASLEQNAAQSLQVHGATPQSGGLTENSQAASRNGNDGATQKTQSQNSPANRAQTDIASTQERSTPKPHQSSTPSSAPAQVTPTAPVNLAMSLAAAPAPVAAQSGAPASSRVDSALPTKAAPAKADAPNPARLVVTAQAPKQVSESYARLLAHRLDQGDTRFELRLDPPDLGKVEARMSVTKEGDAALALKFENQDALDLFSRDRAALHSMLSDMGFSLDGEQLSFSLTENADDANDKSARTAPETTLSAPTPDMAEWHAMPLRSSGAVDIRI